MSEKVPFHFERRKKLVDQAKIQKYELEKEEKKSAIVASLLVSSIGLVLYYLNSHAIRTLSLSTVAFVVEIGTVFFIFILVLQFDSLRREIKKILPELDEREYPFNPSARGDRVTELDIKILSKMYDINKNTIDKLFAKLETFSKTWLAVSGGIASTLLIEIFKSEALDPFSALILITCAAFLWSIAQDLYGILNYKLAKKTKDLAIWWITTI